ncbi:hypothetical protein PM082_022429 [Marasmius tenuissimus]|nr:hypothetical protein PM082_022429 [Marasmius tenuissimus]
MNDSLSFDQVSATPGEDPIEHNTMVDANRERSVYPLEFYIGWYDQLGEFKPDCVSAFHFSP